MVHPYVDWDKKLTGRQVTSGRGGKGQGLQVLDLSNIPGGGDQEHIGFQDAITFTRRRDSIMFCAHTNPYCEQCYFQSQGEQARSRIYSGKTTRVNIPLFSPPGLEVR